MIDSFLSLILTDGTTTIDLLDNDAYMVPRDGYRPRINPMRFDRMGNASSYADVTETIEVAVIGSTQTIVMHNLEALRQLCEQAERWTLGENVTAVLLKAMPQASIVGNLLSGLIYGGAILSVDNYFEGIKQRRVDCTLTLNRRVWRSGSETETVSVGDIQHVVQSLTFDSDHKPRAPLTTALTIDMQSSVSTYDFTGNLTGYILTATDSDHLKLFEAESGTLTNFSSTAETSASGGNVAALNPASYSSGEIVIDASAFDSSAREFCIIVPYRNNSNDVTYTVDVKMADLPAAVSSGETTSVHTATIAAGESGFIVVGYVRLEFALDTIVLDVTRTATGTGTLDIDCVVVLARDDENANILYLDDKTLYTEKVTTIAPRLSTHLTPAVTTAISYPAALNRPVGYRGDAVMEMTGQTLAMLCVLRTDTDFSIYDEDNTKAHLALSVIRGKTYPVLQ